VSTTSLNVSLPRSMRDFIEAECERCGYSTASEYVRALIRAAQVGRGDVVAALPDLTSPTVVRHDERGERRR